MFCPGQMTAERFLRGAADGADPTEQGAFSAQLGRINRLAVAVLSLQVGQNSGRAGKDFGLTDIVVLNCDNSTLFFVVSNLNDVLIFVVLIAVC
jgi:hypothetical protein